MRQAVPTVFSSAYNIAPPTCTEIQQPITLQERAGTSVTSQATLLNAVRLSTVGSVSYCKTYNFLLKLLLLLYLNNHSLPECKVQSVIKNSFRPHCPALRYHIKMCYHIKIQHSKTAHSTKLPFALRWEVSASSQNQTSVSNGGCLPAPLQPDGECGASCSEFLPLQDTVLLLKTLRHLKVIKECKRRKKNIFLLMCFFFFCTRLFRSLHPGKGWDGRLIYTPHASLIQKRCMTPSNNWSRCYCN